MAEFESGGYIKIKNETDRIALASILFKNGFVVSTVRRKKNGKTYEYYVKYSEEPLDIKEEE